MANRYIDYTQPATSDQFLDMSDVLGFGSRGITTLLDMGLGNANYFARKRDAELANVNGPSGRYATGPSRRARKQVKRAVERGQAGPSILDSPAFQRDQAAAALANQDELTAQRGIVPYPDNPRLLSGQPQASLREPSLPQNMARDQAAASLANQDTIDADILRKQAQRAVDRGASGPPMSKMGLQSLPAGMDADATTAAAYDALPPPPAEPVPASFPIDPRLSPPNDAATEHGGYFDWMRAGAGAAAGTAADAGNAAIDALRPPGPYGGVGNVGANQPDIGNPNQPNYPSPQIPPEPGPGILDRAIDWMKPEGPYGGVGTFGQRRATGDPLNPQFNTAVTQATPYGPDQPAMARGLKPGETGGGPPAAAGPGDTTADLIAQLGGDDNSADDAAYIDKLFGSYDTANPKQDIADANAARADERTAALAQLALAAGMLQGAGRSWQGLGAGYGNAAVAYDKGFERYQNALQDSADRYGKQIEGKRVFDMAKRGAVVDMWTARHGDRRELLKFALESQREDTKFARETKRNQSKENLDSIDKMFTAGYAAKFGTGAEQFTREPGDETEAQYMARWAKSRELGIPIPEHGGNVADAN